MRTVLITGIGRGIGKALKDKFLREGYYVLGTYFGGTPEPAKNLTAYNLDLASGQSIESCAKAIAASKKEIDILINNAGVLLDDDETKVIPEKLRQTLEVNLVGTADLTERIIPLMAKGGHIVNISSSAGSLDMASRGESHYPLHYPAYKISKAALNMYTVTLALRLKDSGITVSAVHPGWVKTEMGGEEAEIPPEEAAEEIYNFAISRPETGKFWFAGKRMPW